MSDEPLLRFVASVRSKQASSGIVISCLNSGRSVKLSVDLESLIASLYEGSTLTEIVERLRRDCYPKTCDRKQVQYVLVSLQRRQLIQGAGRDPESTSNVRSVRFLQYAARLILRARRATVVSRVDMKLFSLTVPPIAIAATLIAVLSAKRLPIQLLFTWFAIAMVVSLPLLVFLHELAHVVAAASYGAGLSAVTFSMSPWPRASVRFNGLASLPAYSRALIGSCPAEWCTNDFRRGSGSQPVTTAESRWI